MTTSNNTSKIIVAFHIGRGGRFNNQGFVRYLGEKPISHYTNDLFIQNRDAFGRFVTPYWSDQNGDDVGLLVSQTETGMINIDNDYDTTYCQNIEECTDEEIEKIAKANEFKSVELIAWLEEYSEVHNEGWDFNKYGDLI